MCVKVGARLRLAVTHDREIQNVLGADAGVGDHRRPRRVLRAVLDADESCVGVAAPVLCYIRHVAREFLQTLHEQLPDLLAVVGEEQALKPRDDRDARGRAAGAHELARARVCVRDVRALARLARGRLRVAHALDRRGRGLVRQQIRAVGGAQKRAVEHLVQRVALRGVHGDVEVCDHGLERRGVAQRTVEAGADARRNLGVPGAGLLVQLRRGAPRVDDVRVRERDAQRALVVLQHAVGRARRVVRRRAALTLRGKVVALVALLQRGHALERRRRVQPARVGEHGDRAQLCGVGRRQCLFADESVCRRARKRRCLLGARVRKVRSEVREHELRAGLDCVARVPRPEALQRALALRLGRGVLAHARLVLRAERSVARVARHGRKGAGVPAAPGVVVAALHEHARGGRAVQRALEQRELRGEQVVCRGGGGVALAQAEGRLDEALAQFGARVGQRRDGLAAAELLRGLRDHELHQGLGARTHRGLREPRNRLRCAAHRVVDPCCVDDRAGSRECGVADGVGCGQRGVADCGQPRVEHLRRRRRPVADRGGRDLRRAHRGVDRGRDAGAQLLRPEQLVDARD